MVTSKNADHEHYQNLVLWLNAANKGDQGAYTRFLNEVSPLIRRMIAARLPKGDVEDVLQEVLISLHKARHTYDGTRPVMPWVSAIAQFRITDHLRKYYAGMKHQMLDIADFAETLEGVTERVGDSESLEELLSGVPEREKHILTLMHVEGYTARQVGEKLKMNESAVKVAAHRAIKKLRDKKQREADGAPGYALIKGQRSK